MNGHTLNLFGTGSSQIIVNGSNGGRLDIVGYEDFSKSGTISYSSGTLFKVIDCNDNFSVSGLTISGSEMTDGVANVTRGIEGLAECSSLDLTRVTVNAGGAGGFDIGESSDVIFSSCTIKQGDYATEPLIKLNGEQANVYVYDSSIYTPYSPDLSVIEDVDSSGMSKVVIKDSYVNYNPSSKAPTTVAKGVQVVDLAKTQVTITDSYLCADTCGIALSRDSEDSLDFRSGTIYAINGNAIKYYDTKTASDFVSSDSFIAPSTKADLGAEAGYNTYGTASKIKICSKADEVCRTGYSWFNGNTVGAKIRVDDKNGDTISKSNYTIVYSGKHKLPGTYKATVKFRNDYAGQPSISFKYKIVVKDSPVISLTSIDNGFKVKLKKLSKSYVTGYQVKYSTSESFKKSATKTITVGNSKKTVTRTIYSLDDKKKYYVKTRTFKKIKVKVNGKVKTKTYYSPWWDGPWSVKTK